MPKVYGIIAALILVLTVTMTGCGSATPKQPGQEEKVVNVFNWTEYLPQEVLQGFEQETGIKVNYSTYSASEEMVAKLEAGGAVYDVVMVESNYVKPLAMRGMIRELDLTRIPNFKYMLPHCVNQSFDPGNRYTVPYMWGSTAIAVNTDKIKREITSWNDVWDPAFANQIVVVNAPRSIIGATLRSLGYSSNETDPAKLEEAKVKLQELIPRIKAFDSDSPKTLFINNEVAIGIIWNGDAALAMRENPAIKYIYPKEGCLCWQTNMAIQADARHPNNAHLFIDYICRPEVGKKIAEAYPYSSPNAGTIELLPEDVRNNPVSYPPAEALENAEYNEDLGDAVMLYDRIWSELKAQS